MSRLIVKGLPSYLTDARLREHFAQKGTVTDVKLMRRPDGTSRRFGFVGFRTEAEAEAARAYFDRTYIDTSRMSVALAKQINDGDLQAHKEARRQAREGRAQPAESSAPAKPKKGTEKSASFEEFLSVMAPKLKRKSWQNNEDLEHANTASALDDSGAQPAKKRKQKADDKAPAPAPLVAATADGAAADEELSDLEYMRRRMRHKVAGEDSAPPPPTFEQSDSEEAEDEPASDDEIPEAERLASERRRAKLEAQQRQDEENVDTIMASGRLFVRNLPFSATEDDVGAVFRQYGPVDHVRIFPYDRAGLQDDSQYRDNRHFVCGDNTGKKDSRYF